MKLLPEFASDRESKVCLQVEQISLWSKYLPSLKLLLLVALGYGNNYDHNRLLASKHMRCDLRVLKGSSIFLGKC